MEHVSSAMLKEKLDLVKMFGGGILVDPESERLGQRRFDSIKLCGRPADLDPFRAVRRIETGTRLDKINICPGFGELQFLRKFAIAIDHLISLALRCLRMKYVGTKSKIIPNAMRLLVGLLTRYPTKNTEATISVRPGTIG